MFGKEFEDSLKIGMHRVDVEGEDDGIWYRGCRGGYVEKEVLKGLPSGSLGM
ncbi:MAG: hypothetical protein QXV81_06785 [Ignisphaera sp.]